MASFNLKRFLKKPLKGLENAGRSLGKAARQSAPIVGLIPGVGQVAGAAIGSLGSLAEGRNMGSHIKSGLSGAASGAMNSSLLGGQGLRGVGAAVAKQGGWKAAGVNVLKNKLGLPTAAAGAAGAAGAGGPDELEQETYLNPETGVRTRADGSVVNPGDPDAPGARAPQTSAVSGGGGWLDTLKGLGGTALNFAKKNPDLLLAGGGALLSAKDHADNQKRKDRAMAQLQGEYNKRAPVRDLSLSMLTKEDPRLASLPSIFRNGNPYGR